MRRVEKEEELKGGKKIFFFLGKTNKTKEIGENVFLTDENGMYSWHSVYLIQTFHIESLNYNKKKKKEFAFFMRNCLFTYLI